MAIKSFTEYVNRLNKLRSNVYVGKKRIRRDDPILEPALNVIKVTLDAAQNPELIPLAVTKSHLSGEEINRFTNVHRSIEDLLKNRR